VKLEIHEFTNIEDIFEKCKGWVNDFFALGSLGRKSFDSVTPYMQHFCHRAFLCLILSSLTVYHISEEEDEVH
jgi:hypothetical protein